MDKHDRRITKHDMDVASRLNFHTEVAIYQ